MLSSRRSLLRCMYICMTFDIWHRANVTSLLNIFGPYDFSHLVRWHWSLHPDCLDSSGAFFVSPSDARGILVFRAEKPNRFEYSHTYSKQISRRELLNIDLILNSVLFVDCSPTEFFSRGLLPKRGATLENNNQKHAWWIST